MVTTETNGTKNKGASKAEPVQTGIQAPAGFQAVGVERNFYKNDPANPCQGILLGLAELPNKGNKVGKDGKTTWDAFVVRLTADCMGLDREGKDIQTHKGDEVIVPANAGLRKIFAAQANNPKQVIEIWFRPNGKTIDLGGGQQMKQYDTAVGRTFERTGALLLMGVNVKPREVTALPAPPPMGSEQGDQDLPF